VLRIGDSLPHFFARGVDPNTAFDENTFHVVNLFILFT
jgi:hypothetical protein